MVMSHPNVAVRVYKNDGEFRWGFGYYEDPSPLGDHFTSCLSEHGPPLPEDDTNTSFSGEELDHGRPWCSLLATDLKVKLFDYHRLPKVKMSKVKFVVWQTEVEPGFWMSLEKIKIGLDKLDEPTRQFVAMYDLRPNSTQASSCRMMVSSGALTNNRVEVMGAIRCEGSIKNYNTMEAFNAVNKTEALKKSGAQIWAAILDGTIYSIPSMLNSTLVLSFADLKRHVFTHWFGFPAIHTDWVPVSHFPSPRIFNPLESTYLVEGFGTWRLSQHDARQHGFFLAKRVHGSQEAVERNDSDESEAEQGSDSEANASIRDIGYKWHIGSLGAFEEGFFNGVDPSDQFVCFVDPSLYDEHPSWPIRNLLALVRYRFKLRSVNILCFRDIHARRHEARSIVISFEVPEEANGKSDPALAANPQMPMVTGWMRTREGVLRPVKTDLSAHMNPQMIADQSVDLNNALMKWRISPDLNLQVVKDSKCLLLGAGTLGSYIGRNLLGWGVRTVTFVDNGRVSYSNPVRQPLYTFQDCQNGGAAKAETAAKALREIYPGVITAGHQLSVPMLGHPIVNEAESRSDYDALKKLFDEHDVIFLLMDTRESRWLPTLMGKATGKLVINAALGFDTYLVMRHGVFSPDGGDAALGCYFCNDVVAPEDSTKDITLDQQCTVTRPGIAAIASAMAVELMVSVLQHPMKAEAVAPKMSANQAPKSVSYDRDPPNHALGLIPHQIRGFLASFQNMLIKGESYDCCSACSRKVVEVYKNDSFEFVKKALNDPSYIEELSGLAEVKRQAMEADVGEWSSDMDDDDDEPVVL